MLTKKKIEKKIRENADLLKKYSVSRIGLLGSYVKGNASKNSDIDLLVDFSGSITLFQYVNLVDSIASFLNHKVDLVIVNGIKPLIKEQIMNEVEWIEGL